MEPAVQGIVEVGLGTELVVPDKVAVDGRVRVDGMLSEQERSIPVLMQLLEPLNPKAKLSLK